uniref:Progestagen associated endometrial protein n=1 Tax=Cebus imitator TaxID=2715852 RepID=A0A2K5QSP4_CEBIM
MQCLLLTLGMALVCSVQASGVPQTEQDLEVPKLAGTWHSMAMAASDSTLLEARDAPLRIYITSLMPTAEGNLEIILHRWENNNCVEKKVLAEKTENPKNFRINSRSLEADDEVLKEFFRTFKTLPVQLWFLLEWYQVEEPCPT